HEAQEALVAGALALMAEHLEQQPAVFLGQPIPLVEAVRGAIGRRREAGQRIALRVHASPERPQLGAAARLGVVDLGHLAGHSLAHPAPPWRRWAASHRAASSARVTCRWWPHGQPSPPVAYRSNCCSTRAAAISGSRRSPTLPTILPQPPHSSR